MKVAHFVEVTLSKKNESRAHTKIQPIPLTHVNYSVKMTTTVAEKLRKPPA